MGVHAHYADDLRIVRARVIGNNVEGFRQSPVLGGIKMTRSRGVRIADSDVIDNAGTGRFDQSVYDMTVAGDVIARNTGHACLSRSRPPRWWATT